VSGTLVPLLSAHLIHWGVKRTGSRVVVSGKIEGLNASPVARKPQKYRYPPPLPQATQLGLTAQLDGLHGLTVTWSPPAPQAEKRHFETPRRSPELPKWTPVKNKTTRNPSFSRIPKITT
jgi:hypothetical protein